ncbi:transmembrane protein 215 [Pezoporus occidentalis]|uniref:transmembrane protein 215 n=1 Tax=Pezoporus occidentalis TaxID=407982 RepID=UPI002F91BDFA
MARTMRPDNINPRTGMVVALVSVFLVFGFMFTVSGMKGETLGDIPLLAIGPAICLPGIAAIALTKKTDGCTKWPKKNKCSCYKQVRDRDVLRLLRTPSDLESGRMRCKRLSKKAYQNRRVLRGKDSVSVCTTATAAMGECRSFNGKVEEEMLSYLETCYPEMPGNVLVRDGTVYSALEKESSSPTGDSTACPDIEDNIFVAPKDSIIVCSYKENSPYDQYCCYINPTEVNSDQETIV